MARVWCGRDDDQRGARLRARFNRATTLYSAGPRTRTMMQSCASAAKLRSGGPILPVGTKAKGHAGIPPPRTVIGASSQAGGRDRNCGGAFSVLHSLCRAQNNAVWYNALPHKSPQGDQKLARQGHDHGLSNTASVLGAGSKPPRQGAVLLVQKEPPCQLNHASSDSCQSAFKFDPVSASNFDPFERRVLTVALASSELAGVAETRRARAV
jgi:hypothetical protein